VSHGHGKTQEEEKEEEDELKVRQRTWRSAKRLRFRQRFIGTDEKKFP
jgi:hypothetical protein